MNGVREGLTICATITPPGTGAVAIVRVSGTGSKKVLEQLVAEADEIISFPRKLILVNIFDRLSQQANTVLDKALVVFFKAPQSFTGEDSLEFNIHGSPYVIKRLIENLLELGVALAEPGEFSKRAYLNGQIDLTQAEAICDLIMAESESQAKVASEQLQGKLKNAIDALGEPLRNVIAELEAYIDFPDENLPDFSVQLWRDTLSTTSKEIDRYLQSYNSGRLYREGVKVALVGRPNAGKSSLLNELLGEERAIVTPIPGTTRDHLEERITIDGLLVRLWDTAGLVGEDEERAPGEIEKIGIQRSWKCAADADLVLYLADSSSDLNQEVKLFSKVQKDSQKVLTILTKSDLGVDCSQLKLPSCFKDSLAISVKTGTNLPELKKRIYESVITISGSSLLISTERHQYALVCAKDSLALAQEGLKIKREPELIAIDLRAALGALEEIVGVTHSEDILGRIFSKFCIGK